MRELFEPTFDEIEAWCQSFVPEETLYWVDSTFLEDLPSDSLILPRQEFSRHPTYKSPYLSNAYVTWMMGEGVTYIAHVPSVSIDRLRQDVKTRLLEYQVATNRGLVLPLTIEQRNGLSDDAVVEKDGQCFIVLHESNWKELSTETRHSLIYRYAKEWDMWEGERCDERIPAYLATYANTFPIRDGDNCLAATLFAATQNEWMIHQWIHPETFLQTIQFSGYKTVTDVIPESDDVLTFWDGGGQLVHASYCIRQNLYFNKHGQVRFNPWKLIHHDELMKQWGDYRMQVERRSKSE
ncbi:hypothetical protein ACFQO8_10490 [Exiguobacterium aestuarii]|uniref:NlpC/P60 domain-containing protein n=1 Tax=Exiguobacterium aestuarii TaxID=273527 RepID=A0ABW2PMU7_9BACL|nr:MULTISPECIES: hypothetical protein [Exiguobacterium]MCT4786555.1 hypothetical protein [Exiguobacterium aestuarii]